MTISDKYIIKVLRNNEEAGFKLLLGKYKEPVYWHIRRLVVIHADAEDATQEAFIRMFRSFNTLNDAGSLAAWIFRIATNEALRLLGRRKDEQISLELASKAASGKMATEYVDYDDAETVKLQNAILSLPTKQQLVFNLRYYDELTYEDIANITESSVSATKVNYSIAKKKIINYMNSHD